MKFFVSPEHARLSLKADLATAYMVYCLLRANAQSLNGSSHYSKSEVKSLLIELGFGVRKWSRIFDAGNTIFWNMEYKRVYVRSYRKITKKLERVTGDKVNWNSKYLREICLEFNTGDNSTTLSAKLYHAWFLARGEVTISRQTLSDLFGLSPDRQRHYETLLDGQLLVKHNYAHIDSEKYANNPSQLPEHHFTIRYERFTDDKVTHHEAIQYQLPNTFLTAGNGSDKPTTTAATQSLKKAIRARSWHTESYDSEDAFYSHTWRDFERSKGKAKYVRAYSQGIKKLWLSGQYL